MIWKIVLGFGILGILLGLLIGGISMLLPIVNGPRTSWSEAAIGIAIGGIIFILSFPVAMLGAVFLIRGRKKRAADAAQGNTN